MTHFDPCFLAANPGQLDGQHIIEVFMKLMSQSPEFVLALLFIWAEGFILSTLFCKSKKFSAVRNTKLFHMAIGLVWTSVFIIIYSYIIIGQLPKTVEELKGLILPCAIISSSVTLGVCLCVLIGPNRIKTQLLPCWAWVRSLFRKR